MRFAARRVICPNYSAARSYCNWGHLAVIGLIQRVAYANVKVAGQTVGEIDQGILLLLGVERDDDLSHVQKLAKKIVNYRIFSDEAGKMNLNVQQVGGAILVVSQFTLVADTAKGNRPGFSKGATPEHGKAVYEAMLRELQQYPINVASGEFGADMQVSLCNDGPVTFQFQI